jgi:hypothetical protein
MNRVQSFMSEKHGEVKFIDKRQTIHSATCQPRDIELIECKHSKRLVEEICVDIRIGQGNNPIGIAKGMKHE